ncbi:MAG TPA: glycosyltransferase family 4 protein, partial [Candidatus Krumholzibacteriaceae bacterium]
IPVVHFSHNVEAMIWRRHVENERNPFKRVVFMRERDRVERFEREVIGTYAFTIAVSEKDCEYFRRVYGASRVGSIRTGVDTEFYAPRGAAETAGSILFLGSMDWMPNIDAVQYFVRNIYPFVKSEVPDASLSVVGRSPDASVTALGDGDPSIVVTGTVPDTRVYVDRSAVAVVPMRIGGGTRIKIYEMMAMAKTVVSTSIGAEGLHYADGENILIADEPREFAKLVIKALREKEWRASIGMNARNFVASRCSWEAVAEQFVGLLAHLKER